MNVSELKKLWLAEEAAAHIHGWDFSHIHGRFSEECGLPWDYKTVVRSYLTDDTALLDIDTGGGEFLLSLGHPYARTAATEAYPPNVRLCEEQLLPCGIDFRPAGDYGALPFSDASFDLIINRHGNYQITELYRLLKPGGVFITQQVGEENDRALVELLLPGTPQPFPGWNCDAQTAAFRKAGFSVLQTQETFGSIRFFDIGALVWFARIIEWEFPGFSVERCFSRLLDAQAVLDADGEVSGRTHRFLIVAEKP